MHSSTVAHSLTQRKSDHLKMWFDLCASMWGKLNAAQIYSDFPPSTWGKSNAAKIYP